MTDQTSNNILTPMGGIVLPISEASQIMPGAILTGAEAQFIWRVIEIEGERLLLQRVDRPLSAHAHAWQVHTGTAVNEDCACGARRQMIGGSTGLLPIAQEGAAPRARAVVLAPLWPIQTPRPFSLYLTLSGQVIQQSAEKTWIQHGATPMRAGVIPILPKLTLIWTLPDRLQALLASPMAEPLIR